MTHDKWTWLTGTVCAMLVNASLAAPNFIQVHHDSEVPSDQASQLESSVGVIVYAVDGDKSQHCARCILNLTPGLHQIEIGFSPSPGVTDLAVRMAKNRTVEWLFKKGHAYKISAWEDVKNRTYFVVVFDDTEKVMIYSDLKGR